LGKLGENFRRQETNWQKKDESQIDKKEEKVQKMNL